PKFEGWAWAVMGIAIASPLLSSLVKGWKEGEKPPTGNAAPAGREPVLDLNLKPLKKNDAAAEASITDLFYGEDANNYTRLDITRTQHVIITALLLTIYTAWLAASMSGLSTEQLIGAFPKATPIFSAFPAPGETFTALLFLTHAAYVAGKWQPAR
ncbi:MAG: hypothetical protein AAFP67_08355, partial [Pseudomonadota bacterium]